MKEKVMITGASGFLGFHLIESALKNNMEVYAAVRKSSDIKHLEHLPVSFTYPDFNNIENLQREIESKQYDYIIHAAGVTKAKGPDDYNTVNVNFTYNLAKASEQAKAPVKKFVFISSLAALGPLDDFTRTINEGTVPMPITSYGRSKLTAEEKISALAIPLIILRPTAVYGPRDKDIFIFFKVIKKGLEPYIGKTRQQLSFVYVKDVATAAVNALRSSYNGIYNLSDGNAYSRYDLGKYLKESLQKKTFKFHLSAGLVKALAASLESSFKIFNKIPTLNKEKVDELNASNWICSIEKAKNELGFNPLYNLETGVRESVEWYKEFKWL
jgi:nucleoside-diphosphate-sugar epimerase